MKTCLLFALFLCLLSSSQSRPHFGLDWNTLRDYVMYSYSTYCQADNLIYWNCYWCSQVAPLNVTAVFYDPNTDTYGYAGYTSDSIILSFRGTELNSILNWITDLKFAKTTPYPNVDGAAVHQGFYEAYQSISPQVLNATSYLIAAFPQYPIVVTGHSLGAALSILAAMDLMINGGVDGSMIQAYSFGDPRVGNSEFAEFFNQRVSLSFRTVNQKDIVPHLPLRIMGFQHIATEVWFPSDTQNFIVCDNSGEDPNCSDSLVDPISIVDHLNYLGFNQRAGVNYGCS